MLINELSKNELKKYFNSKYQKKEAKALESQNISTNKEKEEFYLLLLLLIRRIKNKDSLKSIKKIIRSNNLEKDLTKKIEYYILKQSKLIFGEETEIPIKKTTFGESNNKENQKRRKALIKRLILFTVLYKAIQNNIRKTAQLFFKTNKDYNKRLINHVKAQVRSAEAFQKQKRDEIIHEKIGIEGWQWTTFVTRNSSPTCISLNGKFFRKKEYRDGVPNPPPLHNSCNCRVLTITKTEYKKTGGIAKVPDMDKIFKNRPKDAKEWMGLAKQKIWSKTDLKLNSIVDLRKDRFLTNAELIEKFDLSILKKVKGLKFLRFKKIKQSKLKTLLKEGIVDVDVGKFDKKEFLKNIPKDLFNNKYKAKYFWQK